MKIGNLPKGGERLGENKIYWSLGLGRDACVSRYFDGGWRAFEFVVVRYKKPATEGESVPYLIRIAFAFWFPFYFL